MFFIILPSPIEIEMPLIPRVPHKFDTISPEFRFFRRGLPMNSTTYSAPSTLNKITLVVARYLARVVPIFLALRYTVRHVHQSHPIRQTALRPVG